ncbi:MAG: hemerythrin domain-containing protein [Gammaproteobacteria bacterium]|nr:hemerythrin domain-containing protein [Gammaproteobacteria bacterium]MBU1647146.1 hemerythrin domain-containing protein [Gammaproteobacteria bacterium]MBU1972658.1 hemerythrin domain-containing protein [Gammaproteobacteria bacterium]
MLNSALAIIHDEHRSLSAVVHGLKFLVREMREKGVKPDFKLLWAMLYYMDAFSEKLHNPKEDAYLFARLRARTHEVDQTLDELERQHSDSCGQLRALEQALGEFEAGRPGGLESFAVAADKLADDARQHMALEERIVIPLAKQHLTTEDWVEIAQAFGENGDPRFGAEPDHEFRNLFSRIVNLAPPPIGVGPPL